ncbi:protein of unknown function [Taphrina deformans PYCC 5710]|uniref:Uncharacterized protein n=1 Tax=Taphrina deformans (strain PYCC 5710 / ATCC 11124 / CBS 356.35 / IMI 108563 / JCM 9778 / NBRC 8474) TaxID=1097556 RepID=R4X6B1_TAPDE|nr:protein of unknown function [Taphrina deformans PYCC 5710]|eukprot:CCG80535.1 protein of unknown function [Taphrina deformans PYCC 5710]
MTSLQALNRKCPDFEKVMEYLPDAFKDQKAARNRWEKLMRDIKNKDRLDSPTKGSPMRLASSKKPSKLTTSTKTPQKARKVPERYDSDFNISVTPHLDTRSSIIREDCTTFSFDDFNDQDSPFNSGRVEQDTPSKIIGKRKRAKSMLDDETDDFS